MQCVLLQVKSSSPQRIRPNNLAVQPQTKNRRWTFPHQLGMRPIPTLTHQGTAPHRTYSIPRPYLPTYLLCKGKKNLPRESQHSTTYLSRLLT